MSISTVPVQHLHIKTLDEWINMRHVYRKMPHCGRGEKGVMGGEV